MLVEIGALSNIYCPTCGKKNSFEEIECEYTIKNDILRVESLVECEECGGSFKVVQHFTLQDLPGINGEYFFLLKFVNPAQELEFKG